jgi:putative restriction endonuclease
MKFWVGITDTDWYRYLQSLQPDEVNFWQPSAGRLPVILEPGAPFLFKLHAADGGAIVGGAFVAHHTQLPVHLAWDAFGEKNGAPTLQIMTTRIERYRKERVDPETHSIGCYILEQPFFLNAPVAAPPTWPSSVQQGKTYDTESAEGFALWTLIDGARLGSAVEGSALREAPARYGTPALVAPRLGQGSFRVIVTDAYRRRCAITGERTLPVLEAAHIKPFAMDGPHDVDNGLLLRADLHTLFDRGYITVSEDGNVRVSRRIREEFENGRDYYALEGRHITLPDAAFAPPRGEYLEWHRDAIFRS